MFFNHFIKNNFYSFEKGILFIKKYVFFIVNLSKVPNSQQKCSATQTVFDMKFCEIQV